MIRTYNFNLIKKEGKPKPHILEPPNKQIKQRWVSAALNTTVTSTMQINIVSILGQATHCC